MIHTNHDSSTIKSTAYDPDAQTLVVTFKNGSRYKYDNVSADKHDDLLNADSVGSHFHQNIRDQHRTQKL